MLYVQGIVSFISHLLVEGEGAWVIVDLMVGCVPCLLKSVRMKLHFCLFSYQRWGDAWH